MELSGFPSRISRLWPDLQKFANHIYSVYGGPIYIIGSSLDKENARDIDIRAVVSEKDFERLYGKYEVFYQEYNSGQFGTCAWKWSEDRLKRSRWASEEMKDTIDFACFEQRMWQPTTPCFRLDTHYLLEEV